MELLFLILLSVWCGVVTERSQDSVLYYTVRDWNDIYRVPASGAAAEPLNFSRPHCDAPKAIAYDPVHHCIYWTNTGSTYGIGRHCKGQTSSISLSGYKYGIAVDAAHDMLYTSDDTKDTIEIINYDLGTSKTVVRGNMPYPYGIVLDSQARWIFWADTSKHYIAKARTNGTGRVPLVEEGIRYPYGVALGQNNSRLYFCGDHSVQSIGVDGSGRRTHLQDNRYEFNSIAVSRQFLYVRSHRPSYSIWRLAIDAVDATGQDLHKITDIGTSNTGGIVLVESLLQETTATTTTDATTVATTVEATTVETTAEVTTVATTAEATTVATTAEVTTVATTAEATTVATTTEATTATTTDMFSTTVNVNDVTATSMSFAETTTTLTADISNTAVANEVTVRSTEGTDVPKVKPTEQCICLSQDIYKYSLLIAVPIMLVLLVTVSVCFCIKTGKCAKCRSSRIDGRQDADVYYEDVSAIPMSHRPLPAIAQGESGPTSAQPCEDYLVPVPSASGARDARGAAAAQPCDDYLVPVPEAPHTYMEL